VHVQASAAVAEAAEAALGEAALGADQEATALEVVASGDDKGSHTEWPFASPETMESIGLELGGKVGLHSSWRPEMGNILDDVPCFNACGFKYLAGYARLLTGHVIRKCTLHTEYVCVFV
jgi:hypothetical protein